MALNFIETLTNAIFSECLEKGKSREDDEAVKTSIRNIVFFTTKALIEDLNGLLDEIDKKEDNTDATIEYSLACRMLLKEYVEKRGILEFEQEADINPSSTTVH